MEKTSLIVLAMTGLILACPLSSALADPWKNESGHGRRSEHHGDRRWSERGHGNHREQYRERAENDRRRVYEQGREDGSRDAARRNPLGAIGQILGR